MIETVLVNMLVNDPVVKDITTRVRPFQDVTSTARPCITYSRLSTRRFYGNDSPTGQAIAHYQLDVWADTQLTALQLADAVRLALDGRRGTFYGKHLDAVHVTDQSDGATQVRPGEQKPVARITMDVTIGFPETTG